MEDIDDTYIEYYFVGKNIGYGAGHNLAIKKAIEIEAKYHIVLNPDIRFNKLIINELIDFMEKNNNVVELMPKVIDPNGEIQYLCKLLPTPFDLIFRRFLPSVGIIKTLNDRYILKDSGYEKTLNVPCLSGCFMFLRMETIKKMDIFFDERFFLYCEDFDLIRRMHGIGKTIYYPPVSITHIHSRGSYKELKLLITHIKSAIKYFNKWGWFFDKERKEMNRRIINEIKK
jgi:GT2 family glycosyltransferase